MKYKQIDKNGHVIEVEYTNKKTTTITPLIPVADNTQEKPTNKTKKK